jgi:hypothetical protein
LTGADARFQAVFPNDIAVDRCRIQVPVKATCPVVLHRPEQHTLHIGPMSRERQIILNQPLCRRAKRNEANLVPLAFDAKMHDTLATLQVFHP